MTLNGHLYEAPVSLIGKRIDVLYHTSDMRHVEARLNACSYGELHPVDLAVNCRVKRDKNRNTQIAAGAPTTPKGGKVW